MEYFFHANKPSIDQTQAEELAALFGCNAQSLYMLSKNWRSGAKTQQAF